MQRWITSRKPGTFLPFQESCLDKATPSLISVKPVVKGISTTALVMVVLLVGVFLTALNIYELHRMQKEHLILHEMAEVEGRGEVTEKKPVFLAYGRRLDSGYLRHVFAVFDRFGFERGGNHSEWDVLWAHDYPFRQLHSTLRQLKSHQKVNHFPGSGYITNKVNLATSGLHHIPHAFQIPADRDKLLEYAKQNPDKMFVQKSNNHRGIHIQRVGDLDLESEGSFVQEYISNPLLIDGHKFDIGVYTILTSISPLRVYIYNGDILYRFCPEKYHPFDPENLNKYVVGDDYLPTWKVPSLQKYFMDLGFTMKESFNAYIRAKGQNPDKVWIGVHEAIRNIYLNKEAALIEAASRYKSKRNFFEMVRFDLVIDDDLNVYVMEANMSPNLSSAHFPPNKLLYEQVIFNLLSIVGVGRRIHSDSLQSRSEDEESMLVAEKNIMVHPNTCASEICTNSCVAPECQLCKPCLTPENIEILKAAYREHINRQDCTRIFPPQMNQTEAKRSLNLEEFTSENQLIYRWFQGKCLMDASWCS